MVSLENNVLFHGMNKSEIQEIISVIPHMIKKFDEQDVIVHQGDIVDNIGIVIDGNVIGKKYTPDGEEIIVSKMNERQVFGDILSGANGFASPVTVQAIEKCTVLFIDYNRLISSDHELIHKVLRNMIQNISIKYFLQNKRTDILMLKSVREKVITYLKWQSDIKEAKTFLIDLDRRLMADFLGVDRSALSRELSRMKKDGIIDYYKNRFTLLI